MLKDAFHYLKLVNSIISGLYYFGGFTCLHVKIMYSVFCDTRFNELYLISIDSDLMLFQIRVLSGLQ